MSHGSKLDIIFYGYDNQGGAFTLELLPLFTEVWLLALHIDMQERTHGHIVFVFFRCNCKFSVYISVLKIH